MENRKTSFKEWLKNKNTILLLVIAALTNIGNLLSTIDIIVEKTRSFYTWLGESEKFTGHWENNREGYIDGTPDILLKNKSDDIVNLDIKIKGAMVSGEIHTDARSKMCDKIQEKLRLTCSFIASHPFAIEGEKWPFINNFDAYVSEYRHGEKIIIAILNMKVSGDNTMVITNTMRTAESRLFPDEIYMIKLKNEEE
ncbi:MULTISPECIES: hypothetical protein [Pectobacterium]|uniref:hypothetical protein n=1 Tax=Pectobacterium TaxID=122277 RepID=UPI001E312B76|nr:hypothetical protein [Pectobacterium carotovorum]